MKKVFLLITVIILFFISSCFLAGSGGTTLETSIDEEAKSVKILKDSSDSLYVEEFCIGSADIFAFSYNFSGNHWNTPAYSNDTTDTYENDEKAVLLANGLKFSRSKNYVSDLDDKNIPDSVDVLYFDNVLHSVKVEGQWYGDHDRELSDVFYRYNFYDKDGDGEYETQIYFYDVVFINREILDNKIFCNKIFGGDFTDFLAEDEHEVTDAEKNIIKRVHEQVRNIEGSAIFIPVDAMNDMEGGTIKVKVKLDNMIEKIEDIEFGKICWKNTNNMPVDYDISSMQ